MSLIAPSGSGNRGRGGRRRGGKGGVRRNEQNNRIYAHPLPVVFSEPTPSRSLLGLLGLQRAQVLNPHCEGVFDPASRSVWVVDAAHAMILWRRGFFGKGDLSRSEPSWLARQISDRMATARGEMTAEQVREKRRAERAQFKLDRAQAIANVAAEAEKIFQKEGRVLTVEDNRALIPSAATWKPTAATSSTLTPAGYAEPQPVSALATQEGDEEPLEDLEHLQLTLPEAWFLIWTMDCLIVLHPDTHEAMSLWEIWRAFQAAHNALHFLISPAVAIDRFDNPFLVNYVAYHHYRSLGWVVKSGIKFCVDLLLYKRGPVFSHAEFAIVLVPVYDDPDDRETSPFDLPNQEPFSWSWLSTINRVNSQVHKTLILTYITIPSSSKCMASPTSPACLQHYTIREVVVRRFIPARMRE